VIQVEERDDLAPSTLAKAFENVPFLRQVRFCFMPYLLLDQLPPVVIGQTMYGFNKQFARIRSENDSFEVRGPTARVSGRFDREGSPGDIARFPEIFAIRKTLEQPLAGLATDGYAPLSSSIRLMLLTGAPRSRRHSQCSQSM
jgi:hypothetical protein